MDRARTIAIMSDIKEQLQAKALYLRKGVYLDGNIPPEFDPEADLQPQLASVQTSCEVCALGALFLSHIRLYDGVKAINLVETSQEGACLSASYTKIARTIGGILGRRNLTLIECAFEVWPTMGSDAVLLADRVRAQDFGRQYGYLNERLEAIVDNVLANNGEFVP